MKSLFIDAQLFQTNTWNRGMGKYSIDLLNALANTRFFNQYENVTLIFNQSIALDNDRREVLESIHPFKMKFLPLKHISMEEVDVNNKKHNKSTISQFIKKKNAINYDYLILSLFEDNCIAVFPEKCDRKMLLFYDLIPYLFADDYLPSKTIQNYYFSRFPELFEADQIFTISKTTKNDLISYCGLPEEMLINIDGAPIEMLRKKSGPKAFSSAPNKYVLFPSGNDIRKNNARTIKAFNEFNKRKNRLYKLIITSSFDKKTQKQLKELCNDIIFTGNVSEGEIIWLYQNAEAIVFPPLYEGLGLPILEAVDARTTFACSNIPVFQEMTNESTFNLFDPYDIESISSGIDAAVREKFSQKRFLKLERKYSWSNTAKKFIYGYKNYKPRKSNNSKPKIAIFSPTPKGLSTIAKVVQLLHYQMSLNFDITYFFEDNDSNLAKSEFLTSCAQYREASTFSDKDYREFDTVIFHIGNSDYHLYAYWMAQRYPGILIMHDTDLSGLTRVLCEKGLISTERYQLENDMSNEFNNPHAKNITSLVNSALTIVGHSLYSNNSIASQCISDINQQKLNLPIPNPVIELQSKKSPIYNIGLAGILHGVKGLEIVKRLAENDYFDGHTFKLFGYNFVSDSDLLDSLRLIQNIELATNVSDLEFERNLQSLDILVNYRLEYRGETSYTTLEGLRSGTCVIVRDIGWYSELPDDVVVKVNNEEELKQSLMQLISNPEKVEQYKTNGLKFVRNQHSLEGYAKEVTEIYDSLGKQAGYPQTISAMLKDGESMGQKKIESIIRESIK